MVRLSVGGRYREALDTAESADDRVRTLAYWQLFEIQQLGLLQEHGATLERANKLIAELLKKASPSTDERYFLAFAQWYGQVAHRNISESTLIPETLKFDLTFPLANVHSRWRRLFPMSIHPEWSVKNSTGSRRLL